MPVLQRTTIVSTALFFALAANALAAETAKPTPHQIPKVELTEDSAKRSIDAYLDLRKKYGKKIPPAKRAGALDRQLGDLADAKDIVGNHGFKDVADWQGTLSNVVLAYGATKHGTDYDAKITAIKGNAEIPQNVRDQMVEMLTAMRPSDNNLKVVKALAADSTYGAKLVEINK